MSDLAIFLFGPVLIFVIVCALAALRGAGLISQVEDR